MLSREQRNGGFQQRRCRSTGHGCWGTWYVTPGVPAPSLSSDSTHMLSSKQQDSGCWYGLCSRVSRKVSIRFHFKLNVSACTKMNLGLLCTLTIRCFSEGDRGFGQTKSACVGMILIMTEQYKLCQVSHVWTRSAHIKVLCLFYCITSMTLQTEQ